MSMLRQRAVGCKICAVLLPMNCNATSYETTGSYIHDCSHGLECCPVSVPRIHALIPFREFRELLLFPCSQAEVGSTSTCLPCCLMC